MPIIDLQQRMRQLGEIRIGSTVDTGRTDKNGKAIRRPTKLDAFRFTSPDAALLETVAKLYGGRVQPWTPQNGGPDEFEVVSETNRLPVLVPPRNSLTQWYELYKGSKCVRRCDGQTEQKSDSPCVCNPADRTCAITTRLNVMLRNVPALGVWLLTSHGYYAAVELPASAELLAMANGYIPGWLGMEEKVVHRDDGTKRFMVPTLSVGITPAALLTGQVPGLAAGPSPAAFTGGERAALEGSVPDYLKAAQDAETADAVLAVYQAAEFAGHLTPELKAAITGIGAKLRAAEAAKASTAGQAQDAPSTPQASAAVVVDAELVHPDTDEVWMQIVMAAGGLNWTTDQIEQEFAARNDGTFPGSAEIGELRAFLAALKSGAIK